jgi:hypothetical protein
VPITPIQLAANRANAAKSIGSHSPEGNARSASNARSHGFTASNFAVVRIEDLHQVADLKTDLTAVYRPVNSQERFALERMALTQQAILRAARLESGLFTNCLNETLDANDSPFTPMSPDLAGDGPTCRSTCRKISKSPAPRTATTPWPMVSIVWPGRATVGRCSCAIRPRPNATTAAPWRNSTGSKPFGPNYQTNPFSSPNPKKTHSLVPRSTNPFQPLDAVG